MRLININAFLRREKLIKEGNRIDRRAKVFEFCDDEMKEYAILSHRWSKEEVNYEEMTELAKMEKDEQDEVRLRGGYQKILNSCDQAQRDGYRFLWIDTCCIDKRSSAELSEAINSMYRWYEDSKVCYAYLHDVPGTSFPTYDESTYPNSNGYPEWFSRGWTLQEMIAPNNLQFFNKHWQSIGDKERHAKELKCITGVPRHILTDGLSSNRPCVAQIISWAAHRMTTRVEDRAYSLLGLLDVNMPMLYGEGKKAFHRLQLEIIRMSNDQSIIAWAFDGQNERTGSTLADDPIFFGCCSTMELMEPIEFIQYLKDGIPEEDLRSINEDRFGIFPITNRGIQIWLFLRPYHDSHSVFEAWLPCRDSPSGPPVSINLALWKSNYYRYLMPLCGIPVEGTLQFRQLYLRYQDAAYRNAMLKIDDSGVTNTGFMDCSTYSEEVGGHALTLTSTNPLCIKVYSNDQANCLFAIGVGQCFGQVWIHSVCDAPTSEYSWEDYASLAYNTMMARGPENARSMAGICSQGERYGRVWFKQTFLPESNWAVRISCIMWQSSRNYGVRIETFQLFCFDNVSVFRGLDVEGTNDPNCDMRGLMICHSLNKQELYKLSMDKVTMDFSLAPNGTKLGDYGHFTDLGHFKYEGNIFAHFQGPLGSCLESDFAPRQHKIDKDPGSDTESNSMTVLGFGSRVVLYKPLALSLPSNHHFNSFLTSLSTRLANRYLITRVIQCAADHSNERPRECNHAARSYKCKSIGI
ncbi:heterokaryon incompatibility protein-domain-containing protein [Scleroderma yunnanense]